MYRNKIESKELEKHREVVISMEPQAVHAVDTFLVKAEAAWQPSDFLPEMSHPEGLEEIRILQQRAADIPEGVISSLIGNMITEEALPTYQSFFNLIEGVNEEKNMASDKGWVKWSRYWTAEENRHGDLLNKYLYLSGRANMKQVEATIHSLLGNGFDPQTEGDPYQAMIYTSFQERATRISHTNTASLAEKGGDVVLARICRTISGDEARHEKAYKSFMTRIFELDPDGALLAFENMMRKQITMPAILMDTTKGNSLFARFSAITQNLGIYTISDYAAIIRNLIDVWRIEKISGLSSYGARAQEYLMTLSDRYLKIASRLNEHEKVKLPWLVV